ncbi:DnaA ATPase domain-containing protein [Planctomycetota bacterium]
MTASTAMDAQPRLRLERLVVGPSNAAAVAVCHSVITGRATRSSPVVVCGGHGLGKSHLLQATCAAIAEHCPWTRTAFASGRALAQAYVAAMQEYDLDGWRMPVFEADLLIIDDLHCFAHGRLFQSELVELLDSYWDQQKVVLASLHMPPRDDPALHPALVSRLSGGIVVDVTPPGREMRREIVARLARELDLDFSKPVIDCLASVSFADVRPLEAAVRKLGLLAEVHGVPVDVGLAHAALDLSVNN